MKINFNFIFKIKKSISCLYSIKNADKLYLLQFKKIF